MHYLSRDSLSILGDDRCSVRVLVADSRGVNPVVILVMVGSGVGVLVEIHEDVLNLRLLRGIHDHHYRLGPRGSYHCS